VATGGVAGGWPSAFRQDERFLAEKHRLRIGASPTVRLECAKNRPRVSPGAILQPTSFAEVLTLRSIRPPRFRRNYDRAGPRANQSTRLSTWPGNGWGERGIHTRVIKHRNLYSYARLQRRMLARRDPRGPSPCDLYRRVRISGGKRRIIPRPNPESHGNHIRVQGDFRGQWALVAPGATRAAYKSVTHDTT